MVHGVKPGDSPPARNNEVDSSWLGGTFLQYTYPKYFLRSFPNASRASNSSAPFSTSLTHLIRSSFLCSMYFYFSHILSLYQSLFVYIIYLFVLWFIKIRWTKPVSRLCPPYFQRILFPDYLFFTVTTTVLVIPFSLPCWISDRITSRSAFCFLLL